LEFNPQPSPIFLWVTTKMAAGFSGPGYFQLVMPLLFVDIYICQQFVFGFVLFVKGFTLVLVVQFKLKIVN